MTLQSIAYFTKRYCFTIAHLAYGMTIGIATRGGKVRFRALSDSLGYADLRPKLPIHIIGELIDVSTPIQIYWAEKSA